MWPGHCELGSGAGDRKSGRYRGHLLIPPCQDAKSSTSSFLIRIKLHWNFNINIKLLYHWTVDRTLSIFEPFCNSDLLGFMCLLTHPLGRAQLFRRFYTVFVKPKSQIQSRPVQLQKSPIQSWDWTGASTLILPLPTYNCSHIKCQSSVRKRPFMTSHYLL